MRKIEQAPDLTGRDLLRGDTVTTVGGGITGKIKDIANDDGALFVEVRPLYRSSGKGVWHAADRLLWLSRPAPAKPKAAPSPGAVPARSSSRGTPGSPGSPDSPRTPGSPGSPGSPKTATKRVKLKK